MTQAGLVQPVSDALIQARKPQAGILCWQEEAVGLGTLDTTAQGHSGSAAAAPLDSGTIPPDALSCMYVRAAAS